jgi:hypothetical protein
LDSEVPNKDILISILVRLLDLVTTTRNSSNMRLIKQETFVLR